MAESLEGLCQFLLSTEQEDTTVIVDSSRLEDQTLCRGKGLLMTLLTDKHFNR